jgi:hypothetical protein
MSDPNTPTILYADRKSFDADCSRLSYQQCQAAYLRPEVYVAWSKGVLTKPHSEEHESSAGPLFRTLMSEPERFDELFHVARPVDMRKRADRDYVAAIRVDRPTVDLVTPDAFAAAREMVAAVRRHVDYAAIGIPFRPEVCVRFEIGGYVAARARFDEIRLTRDSGTTRILSYLTTSCDTVDAWLGIAACEGIVRDAAWQLLALAYVRKVLQIYGDQPLGDPSSGIDLVFVVINSEPPHRVWLIRPSAKTISAAANECGRLACTAASILAADSADLPLIECEFPEWSMTIKRAALIFGKNQKSD